MSTYKRKVYDEIQAAIMRARRELLRKSDHMQLVYAEIEAAVMRAQRDLRRGVYPRDIQSRLPYGRSEGCLRRDMLFMAKAGKLVRVGGYKARQGYICVQSAA